MSYANVAAHNAPPPSAQPHPDPALLTTPADIAHDEVADDTGKVNVVPHDFKTNPVTTTSEATDSANIPPPPLPVTVDGPAPSKSKKDKARSKLHEAEEEGFYLYEKAKEVILRPPVAGGLIGVGMHYLLYSIISRVLTVSPQ